MVMPLHHRRTFLIPPYTFSMCSPPPPPSPSLAKSLSLPLFFFHLPSIALSPSSFNLVLQEVPPSFPLLEFHVASRVVSFLKYVWPFLCIIRLQYVYVKTSITKGSLTVFTQNFIKYVQIPRNEGS